MNRREHVSGVTVAWFEDGRGFIAIADLWAERLQKERGPEYAAEHFAELYGPEGKFAQGTLQAAQKRAEREHAALADPLGTLLATV